MLLHGRSDEIMCRAFSVMLKGPTRWFGNLHPGLIGSWINSSLPNSLSDVRPAAYLLTLKQGETESLKDEKVILATLLGGIWPYNSFMEELT